MTRRIDDSHQPFKRTRKIGPGPMRRDPIFESKTFKCKRGKPTAKYYVQHCLYAGADGAKRALTVKTKKTWKKKYNKVYRAWAKRERATLVARGPRRAYRCRPTPSTKCR